MERLISFVIIVCFITLSGCWVKVSEETEGFSSKEEQQVIPEHLQCFQQFKNACENSQWQLAYSMLSTPWRERKTFEQFQQNMETVGKGHLIGARIVTVVQTYNNGEEIWALTTINPEKNRTMFMLIKEKDGWKVNGVKNLP